MRVQLAQLSAPEILAAGEHIHPDYWGLCLNVKGNGVTIVAGVVSSMCGFCDYVYFLRVFKKYTGLTPSKF